MKTVTDTVMATANSEVIQALEPPTEASPLWMRTSPEESPQMRKATYRIPHDGRAAGTAAKLVLHVAGKLGRRVS